MNYKPPVLIAITLVYLYNLALAIIRARSADNPIPANVADVYDPETYGKWRRYHAEKSRLEIITSTLTWIVEMLLIGLDLYAGFARLFPDGYFPQMLGVVLLMNLADLALLPVNYYDTMTIEQKYGFNRTTQQTFWLDKLKEFLIGAAIALLVGSLLMWMHQALGDMLIIAFAAVMTLLALFVSFMYPFFSRIFNKFTPLEDGALRDRLTGLLAKYGYQVRGIQVMDASRRSSRSNAYFTGFGKMKTIVLYDTLLQQMTPDEICAVFAHEMGHGLHRDTLRNQVFSFARMLLLGVLAWLTLRNPDIYAAFGFGGINYGFALLLILNVEFALLAPLTGLLFNHFSRKAEYRADAQAVAEGYGEALITGLKKLARGNFAELAPNPLLVKLEASHPSLSQRISAIERAAG